MAKHTYISLLRGINVGGSKVIRMTDLKAVYESLGFKEVISYIQSGNVLFRSNKDASAVSGAITKAIERKFGFDVAVIVREPKELAAVIRNNPFIGLRGVDEARLAVTFLQERPSPSLVRVLGPLAAKSNDEYKVVGKEVYLHCPTGFGKTLFTNTFFEKHLKVATTARNWRTVNILVEMADALDETAV
jgi:uncharacterized protein (DUF1697 family)